jgi:uncharacterized protein YbjT (DUF2867 family)
MKIVVIGGTGLIGSKTVAILRQGGHEVVAASPSSGVNSITGEGLKEAMAGEAMAGAQVVIDLANSPSFEDKAVLEFFETSGRNLLAAEAAAGVRHHIVPWRNTLSAFPPYIWLRKSCLAETVDQVLAIVSTDFARLVQRQHLDAKCFSKSR